MGSFGAEDDFLKGSIPAGVKKLNQLIGQAPTQQPSLADPSIQAARKSQMLTAQLARGRSSTFTAGSAGVQDAPPVYNKTLLGE